MKTITAQGGLFKPHDARAVENAPEPTNPAGPETVDMARRDTLGVPEPIAAEDSSVVSVGNRRTFARMPNEQGADDWAPVDKRSRLAIGRRIPKTRYRITSWLGEGGMGEVFSGVHVDIERPVALKIVRHGMSPELCERFVDEARKIAQIESRFVVDVLDFGELPDGRPFYAMELLRDYSLHSLLDDHSRLPLERTLPILRQLCKALAAVHETGLAHRDLKPENILLQNDAGREDMVRVVDFGIAAKFGPEAIQIAGTPLYMAPEQLTGAAFDGRVDVYALGCLAYEMLSGEPPFSGSPHQIFEQHMSAPPDSLTGRWPELPEQLDELLSRCLAKKPEDRFANALELEAALCELQIVAGFTTPWDDLALPEVDAERKARLVAQMPRPRSATDRKRKLAIGIGGLACVLAAVAWVAWPDDSGQRNEDDVAATKAWLDDYADKAREAAARACWVYPPAAQRNSDTAQDWVLAIESKGHWDPQALARANQLRSEFAATLVNLGDEYWDADHGRPFAVEFYAQALIFEPGNERASERVMMTKAQLADVEARAARGEFSEAELATGEMLAALAEPDEKTRRARVRELVEDSETPVGGPHARDQLLDLVGLEEAKAEVAEAMEAGALPGSDGAEASGMATATNAKQARELAEQGRKALDKGKRDKAERLFHKALEADERNLEAVAGLAQVYFDRGKYGQALSYAKKANRLRPRDRDLRLLLGDSYLKVLRYADARTQYQMARDLGHPRAAKRLERLAQLTK